MKILIVVPSFQILGGVANHYIGLSKYWNYDVNYVFVGKRKHIPALMCLIPDLLLFIYKLSFGRYDVVVINPSLRYYQLLRDSIYLLIAKLFRKHVVTFIHGWDDKVAKQCINHPHLFRYTFGKSSFIYVLYSHFREQLEQIRVKAPVVLTTTKVSNDLIENFDIRSRVGKIENILFLARAELNKGLIVSIDAYNFLKGQYPNLTLTICGTGNGLDHAKSYVKEKDIDGVCFLGRVEGEGKIHQFENADLYILPTTHGEGMATSVLEAMAFGLPVITRPVGGVCDFFHNFEMGFLVESLDAKDFAEKIEWMIKNPDKVSRISINNYEYAKKHFLSSIVTKKYESDIEIYCQ